MNKGYILLMAAMLFTALSTSAKSFEIDRSTVRDVELKRYMGRW